MAPQSEAAALLARSHRLGADPRNTNYAGGNTSAKGTDTDPVTGGDVELMWVKGSGGDLGTLTEDGLAVLRLDRLRALDGRLPGGGARGRDGRRVRLLPARQGRRRALHRHRDARPGGRRARRPSAPRLRDRARLRRGRGEADRRMLRRHGGVGAVAPARLPARPGHRGGQGGQPAGDRLRPRRSRHHGVGRHGRGVRAQLAAHHPYRGGVPRRAGQGRAVRPGARRVPGARTEAERRERAAALAPFIRALASQDRPQVGHFTDSDVVLDFLAARRAPAARRARHLLPRPLPADEGQARWSSTCRRRLPWTRRSRG